MAASEYPNTDVVDVSQALETLSYREMIALAAMYERWALTEENISPDQRTQLVVWCADYELIAAYAGEGWEASDPSPQSLIPFVARLELNS